jgi:hypothetical protein
MSKPHLPSNEFICTIHNVQFGAFHSPKTNSKTDCPICAEERIVKLADELEEARQHRDLLLSVIELRQTVIPAPPRKEGA